MARAHLAIAAAALAAFVALGLAAHACRYFAWDLSVASSLQKAPGLWLAMRAVSAPGYGRRAVALVLLTVLALRWAGDGRAALLLPLSAGIGELVDQLAKRLVARPRPGASLITVTRHLGDPSFPSGHVVFYCSYFGFLFALAYLHRTRAPRLAALAMLATAIPVVLVGVSRVYLGAHWPSDVLGGYLLGAANLSLTVLVYRRWAARSPAAPLARNGA